MLAPLFCQNFIKEALNCLHTKTKQSLINHVQSLLSGRAKLSLSSIGRHLPGNAQEKHKINMSWRFIGNTKIHDKQLMIYQNIFKTVLSGLNELIIAIDWSGCCSKELHVLRASLVYEGRSITIYNEIHEQNQLGSESVHQQFLTNLSKIIPPNKKVILITDAGFRTSWFSLVEQAGWFYVGRVSGIIHYKLDGENQWKPLGEANQLIQRGETQYWGTGTLGRQAKARLHLSFIAHWGQRKNRKVNKPKYPDAEKQYSKMNSEPWVLVTNLSEIHPHSHTQTLAQVVTEIYKKRMQIEQNFRDDKSERFGFGWRFSRTRDRNKVSVLMLLASIASLILWMMGYAAEKKNLHYHFQANTVRSKRVLSLLFLAKQLIINGVKKLKIRKFSRLLSMFHLDYNLISPLNQLIRGDGKK